MTERLAKKTLASAIIGLVLLAGIAGIVMRLEMPAAPVAPFFAFFLSLSLSLGAFVSLTDSRVVRWLRRAATQSVWKALLIPLLLLIPYFTYTVPANRLTESGFLKLLAYILAPTLLLLPDRLRAASRAGWRDFAAMAALAVPVASGWLGGIWHAPGGVPLFRPLYSVCAGGYAFLAVRNLQDAGYRLIPRRKDLAAGAANFAGFVIVGIPAGYALRFIRFHAHGVSPLSFAVQFVGIYVMIAIPEEFLFRGILQNFLEKSIRHERKGAYALIIASVIFGLSHLHHPPVPNWRYGIMAGLAGLFYGNAYRDRRRLPACAFTHALVDATWHFWF
jgi:uncharacterized protein